MKDFLPGDTIKRMNGDLEERAWVVLSNDFGFGYTTQARATIVFEQWQNMLDWKRYNQR